MTSACTVLYRVDSPYLLFLEVSVLDAGLVDPETLYRQISLPGCEHPCCNGTIWQEEEEKDTKHHSDHAPTVKHISPGCNRALQVKQAIIHSDCYGNATSG